MNILITTFGGALVTFDLGDPVPLNSSASYSEREFAKAWSRFKVRDRSSFNKAAVKWFPNFVEIETPAQDQRLLINNLIDDGHHVWLATIDSDNRVDIRSCFRMDEDGQHINTDGVPMSLCDLQGVPYPEAPEGQHRYRISVNYVRGASFCDYHKMWIGVNAKEAAKLCLDYLANSPDTKQLRDLFGATPELINQVLITDVDSQDMKFFFGADLSENSETDALTTVFRHMSGMDDTEQEMDLNSLFESFGKLF